MNCVVKIEHGGGWVSTLLCFGVSRVEISARKKTILRVIVVFSVPTDKCL